MENNGPYQSECQFGVAIDDIFGADVHQFDLKDSEKQVKVWNWIWEQRWLIHG